MPRNRQLNAPKLPLDGKIENGNGGGHLTQQDVQTTVVCLRGRSVPLEPVLLAFSLESRGVEVEDVIVQPGRLRTGEHVEAIDLWLDELFDIVTYFGREEAQ